MTSLSITTVGDKTASFNLTCYMLTIISGMCLIFPICFMFCNWWKNLVSPMYEMVSPDFYPSLGRFLNRFYTINTLHLTICDSSFDG